MKPTELLKVAAIAVMTSGLMVGCQQSSTSDDMPTEMADEECQGATPEVRNAIYAAKLKNAYGEKVCFHGAIEKTGASKDELVAQVKEMIDKFGPGGGYVFASCNHIIDAEPQNVTAMFETAREYGRY